MSGHDSGSDSTNQYLAFVRGWLAGARGAEKDPAMESRSAGCKSAYVLGYERALEAREIALRDAASRYGGRSK